MSSTRLGAFRSFLTEKFMNLAVELFEEVETIVETYYEENKRQRTILQMALNPQIQLSKIDIGQHTGATPNVKKQPPQLNTLVQPTRAEPLPKKHKEEQIESDKNSKADDLLTTCVQSDPGEEENINMPYIVNSFHIPAEDPKPDFTASHSGDEEVIYGHKDILTDCNVKNVDVVVESLSLCQSEGGTTECGEPQNSLISEKTKSKHLSTKRTPTKPCLQETKLELPSGVGESPQTFNDARVTLRPIVQLKSLCHRSPHGHCNDIGQHTGATPNVKKQPPQLKTLVQPTRAEPLPKKHKEEQIESDKNSKADDLLTTCVQSDPGEEENINMPYIVNSFHIPAEDPKPDFTASHSESLSLCQSEGGTTECGEPQNSLISEKTKSKHLSTKRTPTKPCLQETKLELPSGVGESPQTFNDARVTLRPIVHLKSLCHRSPHGHCNSRRLIQVKYKQRQRYVTLDDTGERLDFLQFHKKVIERFSLPPEADIVYKDSTGTQINEEIFSDRVRQGYMLLSVFLNNDLSDTLNITTSESSHSRSTLTLDEIPNKRQRLNDPSFAMLARQLVEGVLKIKSGGEEILQEYHATDTLTNATRRKMVNILVAHMTDIHGLIPSKSTKEMYALGIVTLFPSLKDPNSIKGYEYFYDATRNTGCITLRLKTVNRKRRQSSALHQTVLPSNSSCNVPECQRDTNLKGQLNWDACIEAISLLKQTTESLIFQKMNETFQHRRKLVGESDRTADIFSIFPRFLNVKGLVDQDFTLLFGDETSSMFLEKWDMFFRPNVIKQAKTLTSTPELRQLLLIAEGPPGSDLVGTRTSDQQMSSLLLLLHLLPPPPGKSQISACDAAQRLVVFHKKIQDFKEKVNSQTRQYPYLVAVGFVRSKIDSFYIAVDKHLIPCQTNEFLVAFDELFKAHFVFNLPYDAALVNFYTFLQTTVYKIDCPEAARHQTEALT
ncbi:uncharacterized protein LOC114855495 isoform X2 [Betta splendens]|uniref:Uncharacterized protein LOC114855495 isoform X2 n=1 Tax=Betta splendens TaxID=158456 RepID=A0A6P7MIW5_BETSP|nr:uncharacterized protein LOC114855495 isoform X2 [Betta splendens]